MNTLALDPRDPDTIYAGATGAGAGPGSIYDMSGVFKSSDGGASWHPAACKGRTWARCMLEPQQPETVYAGTDDGVVKSTDGGAAGAPPCCGAPSSSRSTCSSRRRSTPALTKTASSRAGRRPYWRELTMPRGAELLALDPRHSARLYASSRGRILTSLDAGRSWRATGRGPGAASISAFAVDARTGTAYAGIGEGLAKRTGGRWRTVNMQTPVGALAVDAKDPDVLYAGADNGASSRARTAAAAGDV